MASDLRRKKLNKSGSPLYQGATWRDTRERVLSKQPYCVVCEITTNLHIDHIWECEENPELFYWEGNLQTLCRDCHSSKTFFDKYILNLQKSDNVLKITEETNKNNDNDIDSYMKILINTDKVFSSSRINEYNFDIKSLNLGEIKEILINVIRRIKKNFQIISYNNKEFDNVKDFGIELIKERMKNEKE